MNLIQEIKQYFNVSHYTTTEIQVFCPYHSDIKNKSASINIDKQLFNCFAGCGGRTFQQLYNELINETHIIGSINNNIGNNSNIFNTKEHNTMSDTNSFAFELSKLLTENQGTSYRILKEISNEEILLHLRNTIISKGISPATLSNINAVPIINPTENLFGYIKFPIGINGDFLARKFLPDDVLNGERYLNPKGEKPFFGEIKDDESDYILVEGVFDYLSLVECGYKNVICNLGTAINPKRAYQFRNKVVFILFDNDFAGYEGSQKAYTILRRIQANPIILDLPKTYGKDINESIKNRKGETITWLNSCVKVFDSDDTNYITTFNKQESLYTLKTGIKPLDDVLMGGMKVGIHAIAAEPGVGKTALSLFITQNVVQLNENVKALYCTYEVPKSQCWARLSSIYDNQHSWTELETNPTLLSEGAKNIATKLADRIRIVSMWNINEIVRASRNYKLIVIDYIQRMPGDTSDERTNTARNTKELSKLMMEEEKIIILISSIPRVAYGKEDLSIFKECGDIEFCIQSGFLLKDINKGGEQRMLNVVVLKNTRGPVGGNFWLEGNMLRNTFKAIEPEL